jgi:beta-lactamase class A
MRICALLIATAVICRAEPNVRTLLAEKTVGQIKLIESRASGVAGVAAIDLTTGETLKYNDNAVFPQASSIKVPIMMRVFSDVRSGKLRLDRKFTLKASDSIGGSGHLKAMLRSGPLTPSLVELITAMIETSDNTATNKLIGIVGMQPVNDMLDSLGFRVTRLRRIMLDSAAARRGDENVSTPMEMARIMELIYRGKAVDADASKQMIGILKLVDADFRDVIPAAVAVASKPGSVPGVHCESGIVFLEKRPFVMSVMSTFLNTGENPVKEIARAVFDYFDKVAHSNEYGNRTE